MAKNALGHGRNPMVTARQRALVEHLVRHGGTIEHATQAVGLSRSSGYAAMRKPEVRELLLERTRQEITTVGVPMALKRILDLIRHGVSEHVALHAAKDLLDRAGLIPPRDAPLQDSTLIVNICIDDGDRPIVLHGEPVERDRPGERVG